jgi:hypothetical protein
MNGIWIYVISKEKEGVKEQGVNLGEFGGMQIGERNRRKRMRKGVHKIDGACRK